MRRVLSVIDIPLARIDQTTQFRGYGRFVLIGDASKNAWHFHDQHAEVRYFTKGTFASLESFYNSSFGSTLSGGGGTVERAKRLGLLT
jgi:hypothetical protein